MIRHPGHVYFARCVAANGADMEAIKIGLSYDPPARIASVGSLLPFTCEFIGSTPGCLFAENFIHMWLREEAIGGEYFHARGETLRVADHVARTGELPPDMRAIQIADETIVDFRTVEPSTFMHRHKITFEDTEKLAGVGADYHRKLIERKPKGNRRFLAALAVTAVRKGRSVYWPRDFQPPTNENSSRSRPSQAGAQT